MMHIAATYAGLQEWPGRAAFELWTLIEPLSGHPVGSTVSLHTLTKAGYVPVQQEAQHGH